jgi:DNA-directed RNA polymerase specialized sigma24 family protein
VADDATDGPDAAAIGRELAGRIGEALAKLPLAQRAAIELTALGYGRDELAEALDVTPGNAGVILHRARLALLRELGTT